MHLNIPTTKPLPDGFLDNPLPMDRVLYEAEEPIIYLTHTKYGQTYLAYLADESEEGVVTLLSPISKTHCGLLENGCLSVRDALTASSLWLHLRKPNGGQQTWIIEPSDIPNDFLPVAGTLLLPEHEAVFRTRAIGDNIVLGKMPASVIGFVADATRSAFKTLLDFMFAVQTDGRPQDNYRKFYDFPVRQVEFNSFELGFAAPDFDLCSGEEMQATVKKLEEGLIWAACQTNEAPLSAITDEEQSAILRACLMLTPPNSGAISEIEISGTWIQHGRIKLTRSSRKKVNKELHKLNKETVVTYCGRIGEIDDDKLSFILRDVAVDNGIGATEECKGFFEEALLDDMKLFYYEGIRVAVAGIVRKDRLSVTAVAPENSFNN